MMRAVKWTAINAALFGCLLLASIHGTVWAENIILFATWAMFPLWVVAAGSPDLSDKIYEKGPSVPRPVGRAFDIAVLVILVAMGWFLTATAFAISALIEEGLYNR